VQATADETVPPTRPVRRGWSLSWLTAAGIFLAGGMLLLGIVVLVDLRNDAWQQAEKASDNLAAALEQSITRNFLTLDLSVQGVAEALALPGINDTTPQVRQAALFDRTATAEYLGVITVLDAQGNLVTKSTPGLAPMNYADREYFKAHQQRSDLGLFISRPFRSRISGKWVVTLTRRLLAPDGGFGGVVVAAVYLELFSDMFEKLDLGPNGSVTLFRDDGRVIARNPMNESDIDRDLGAAKSFQECKRLRAGHFVNQAAIDQVTRLYTCRRFRGLPLVLSVAVSTDHILAAWRGKAAVIGVTLVTLCVATVALSLLFRRELRRRQDVEASLRAAAERLSTLASTDALTGLGNRRVFEAALDQEWCRAIRQGLPMALLMLDVDFFKAFNDHYGHQAGDQVLKRIAGCMAWSVGRSGDLAARYGGEEFVILLPETDNAGALALADRIREEIEGLDIQHRGSVRGRVTASIGAAAIRPQAADRPDMLVEAADKALYTAKSAGRNRVALARDQAAAAVTVTPAAPSADPAKSGLRLVEPTP
jgi:diguanylate cyclase (GGDEF)-like protein